MRPRCAVPVTLVLSVLLLTSQAHGVLIKPSFDGDAFPGDQTEVLLEAIQEWSDLLPCEDGFRLDIFFTCDTTLNQRPPEEGPALALTKNWMFDDKGRPLRADIVIDNDDHNWDVDGPWPGLFDASQTLKHEIAHALGFTVASPAFAAKVWPPSGTPGDRFYDFNGDHIRNGNDFDLIDDPGAGTHAPDGSGDLMERYVQRGTRRTPSAADVAVLVDAFDYCPEPGALAFFALGGLAVRRRRWQPQD